MPGFRRANHPLGTILLVVLIIARRRFTADDLLFEFCHISSRIISDPIMCALWGFCKTPKGRLVPRE